MIAPTDRLSLPRGVRVTGAGVVDEVRAAPLEVNAVGRLVLGATSCEAAARELAERFDVAEPQALADALAFASELNERLLLNVAPRARAASIVRWGRMLPLLLPLGALPALPRRRHRIDTTRTRSLLVSALAALVRPACALGAAATAIALLVLPVSADAVAHCALLGAAVAAGVVVHELGHLALLRGVPACVVVRGVRVAVVHGPVTRRRERVAAGAGPAAALASAAGLAVVAALASSAAAATVVGVLVLQALGLTVLSVDGRRACGLT